ncbi:MAG: D-alanine--D-alanine ligase [Oscillospiraceae bacterium]|jgi:D-alanine--(R)-lactate ligase|nr:D-alanine--D-alanine ligase [Oscillospiraceae bacterium]
MSKPRLLVLYGGVSEEHGVSIKSARELARGLDLDKYTPVYVYITREGRWLPSESPFDEPARGSLAVLSTDKTSKSLLILKDGRYSALPVDCAFPMLHGKYGEDGTIQGILDASGIPYVGCGASASILCMDKPLAYLVALSVGITVPRHCVLAGCGEIPTLDLPYPLIVKPARSGSSFGVSKVNDRDELLGAVRHARLYDDKVLIEEHIAGREISCAMLGNGSDPFVGELDQIELSGGFFRIHQEANPEQGSGNAAISVPAPIPDESRALAIATAKTIYRALGCRGLARVDMFLTPDNKIVLNEINTMPGFTSYSRYPRMMACAGVNMRELIDRLIALALDNGGVI